VTEEKNESPLDRMGPDVPRCGRPTKAGGVCPRVCQPDSDRCFTHGLTPEQRAEQGRSANRKPARNPVAVGQQLTSEEVANIAAIATRLGTATEPTHVRDALAQCAALVLAGSVPPRIAVSVNALANTVLRSISDNLTAELAELKAALKNHASTQVQSWARRSHHRQ